MDKQQRLRQLNQHGEGYVLSEHEIVADYNNRYRAEPTPYTNPELFDPLNPPPGWEYDAWHCFWYKLPTADQAAAEMFFLRASIFVTGIVMLWMIFR